MKLDKRKAFRKEVEELLKEDEPDIHGAYDYPITKYKLAKLLCQIDERLEQIQEREENG